MADAAAGADRLKEPGCSQAFSRSLCAPEAPGLCVGSFMFHFVWQMFEDFSQSSCGVSLCDASWPQSAFVMMGQGSRVEELPFNGLFLILYVKID